MPWRAAIARRSRNPAFLWRLAIGIVAVGVAVSFLTPLAPHWADSGDLQDRYLVRVAMQPDEAWSVLAEMAADPRASFYQVLQMTAEVTALRGAPPGGGVFGEAAVAQRGTEAIRLARELIASVAAGAPTPALESAAHQEPAAPYAGFALALFWINQDRLDAALGLLRQEGALDGAREARELLVRALVQKENWSALEELSGTPEYQALVPYFVRARLAAERGDWWAVLRYAPESLWRRWETGPGVLAVFTGACWLAFLLHAGRAGDPRGVRWTLCAAGLALGVLSIPVTHFLIYYQEVGWGLVEQPGIAGGVKYFVLGVGLREELSKFLLFLPLAPVIVRRGSELEALIAGACVGLGFAMAENVGYFTGSMGTSTISRFVTANFVHMALTGLVGLAVCRGVWHPRTSGPESAAVFGVAVLAHGLYDSLLAVPALAADFSFGALIIFILLAYQFFHELRAARPEGAEPISLTFTFVVGVALITSATFVYASALTDQSTALGLIGAELIASAAMIYLFLREAPDSLIER